MYAIFWIDSDGTKGNGEYTLDEETLRAWLGRLRLQHPEMSHWGQSADGERYVETIPIPLDNGRPAHVGNGNTAEQSAHDQMKKIR